MYWIFGNILINTVLTAFFVLLYTWEWSAGLVETFVTLAMVYGSTVIVANAVYIAVLLHKKQDRNTRTGNKLI